MSKVIKQMELDALTKTFDGVRDMVLMSSERVGALLEFTTRKSLRDKKVRLQMVKNTLARRVFENNGIKLDDKVWSGTTVVAWGGESVKELSKTVDALLRDIAKKNPKDDKKLIVKTAVADGQAMPLDMAMKIPTRLEAIGEIIGMILGPGAWLAGALTGPAEQLAGQIASIVDKQEGGAAA